MYVPALLLIFVEVVSNYFGQITYFVSAIMVMW